MDVCDRRTSPRIETAFFAVEVSERARYQRLVRNISAGGFAFEERLATKQVGEPVFMDFPVPGSAFPLRVAGQVRHAQSDGLVGVMIEGVDQERYAKVLASPPNMVGSQALP